jgi:hypothetical protein
MGRMKRKEQVYRSMKQFEKKLFPVTFKKRSVVSEEPRVQAAGLADESLRKIRRKLVK